MCTLSGRYLVALAFSLFTGSGCTQITSEKRELSSGGLIADFDWDKNTCWGDDGLVCSIDTAALATTEEIFKVVEEVPKFPGGELHYTKFLKENLRYPDPEACFYGRIIVRFVVERDGGLTNVEILRGIHESFDQEALRVIGLMPRWTPGKIAGQAVRTEFTMPIEFRL